MNPLLAGPLGHDSVWSFVTGADDSQLRQIEHRTGYKLRLFTIASASSGCSAHGALYLPLAIRSDEELAAEHERIVAIVHEIVHPPWQVETLFFEAGAREATYHRLGCWKLAKEY